MVSRNNASSCVYPNCESEDCFPVPADATGVMSTTAVRDYLQATARARGQRAERAYRELLSFLDTASLWSTDHPAAWLERDGSRAVRFRETTPNGRMEGKAVIGTRDGRVVIDVGIAVDAGATCAVDVAESRRFKNVRDAATFITGRHLVHRLLTQRQ